MRPDAPPRERRDDGPLHTVAGRELVADPQTLPAAEHGTELAVDRRAVGERGDFLAAEHHAAHPVQRALPARREGPLRRVGRLAAQAVLPAIVLYGAWQLTAGLVGGGAPAGTAAPPAETVYAVTAVDVAPGLNRATFRAFGEVVAVESAELRIASPGEVIDLADDLAVGELVEAGTALVTVDPFAYEGALREARAQLAESRARLEEAGARVGMQEAAVANAAEQLRVASRDLERAEQLARSGTITEQALDERRLLASERTSALDSARYALAAERARQAQEAAAVDRLDWAEERAERALADTVLRAPFRGIVREENVALGGLLATNDLAVSLVRADALDVRFTLSDARYGQLIADGALVGAAVDVTWRVGDTPLAYSATVRRVGADITADTGGIDVYARLDLPQDRATPRPGAFVEVALPGPPHPASFRVPASALYGGRGGAHVFVIGEDGRLHERAVAVLATDGGEVILSAPIAAGEEVVTTRLAEAGEGVRVRRVVLDAAAAEPS